MVGEKESKSFEIIQSWKALDKSIIHIILLDFIYYSILLFVGSFYVYKVLPQALQLLDAASLLKDEITMRNRLLALSKDSEAYAKIYHVWFSLREKGLVSGLYRFFVPSNNETWMNKGGETV